MRDLGMGNLPETGFMRLHSVLNLLQIGKATWYKGIREGRYPKPVKLTERCSAWRAEDIRSLIDSLSPPESGSRQHQ